jgi:hypothetical protein
MLKNKRQPLCLVADGHQTQDVVWRYPIRTICDGAQVAPAAEGPGKQHPAPVPKPKGSSKPSQTTDGQIRQRSNGKGVRQRGQVLLRSLLHGKESVQERLELTPKVGARQAEGHGGLQEADLRAAIVPLAAETQAEDALFATVASSAMASVSWISPPAPCFMRFRLVSTLGVRI